MSQQYDNTLSGALFRNDKTKPTHPDYRGSLETEAGQQYWVSAWIKESRAKGKFLSLALTPKDESGPRRSSTKSDTDDFLASVQDKTAAHRQRHSDAKNDMQGGPVRPSNPAPSPAPDFDSFDDDIPF